MNLTSYSSADIRINLVALHLILASLSIVLFVKMDQGIKQYFKLDLTREHYRAFKGQISQNLLFLSFEWNV